MNHKSQIIVPTYYWNVGNPQLMNAMSRHGGWNPNAGNLTRIHAENAFDELGLELRELVMDSFVAAASRGQFDAENYVYQLFASQSQCLFFCTMLIEEFSATPIPEKYRAALLPFVDVRATETYGELAWCWYDLALDDEATIDGQPFLNCSRTCH